MNLISISALTDNYIWLLYNDKNQCIVVDPGEATPVLKMFADRCLIPVAILLTHHHDDHVGGIAEILRYFPVPVYGPEETSTKGASVIVNVGDNLTLLNHTFSIIALPGHTLGHIGFYSPPWLFSGDTIFSAGCGKIFEGTSKQMYESFQKINQLPANTIICAAHEYTLNNLDFASSIFPQDSMIMNHKYKIKELRLKNQPSLPTTLYLERLINPFFRCHEINLENQSSYNEEWNIFSLLRAMKDHF